MKNLKLIGFSLIILIIFGFSYISLQNQNNQLIIGTWKQEDEPNILMVFTNDY